MPKGKDPALLLYTKDFYEGTRTMLPEERAAYMDLLIYQHQKGVIPDDMERLAMYCSGCSVETVKRVLNQKFNQMVDGWSNTRLSEEMSNRKQSQPKKIAAATLAGLISKSKLNKKQREEIKSRFIIEKFIQDENGEIRPESTIKEAVRFWFKTLVEQELNQPVNQTVKRKPIENVDENANEDQISDKGAKSNSHEIMAANYLAEHSFPPEFCLAWMEWIKYKHDVKSFTYKSIHTMEKAMQEALKSCGQSFERTIDAINYSIGREWEGIHPREKNPSKSLDDKLTKNNTAREIAEGIIKEGNDG